MSEKDRTFVPFLFQDREAILTYTEDGEPVTARDLGKLSVSRGDHELSEYTTIIQKPPIYEVTS